MTDVSTLREIISDGDWYLSVEEALVERDLASMMLDRARYDVVEVVTGVRRAGKSKLMLWVGRKLKKSGRNVYYINFEDDRIDPDKGDFQKINSIIRMENTVILVDEPQNMPGWEKWARRLHERGVKVYVTGSNSKLLGTELATALAGRKKQHEIFPFSFGEYMRARDIAKLPRDQMYNVLEEYMRAGGYPYPTVSGDYSILEDYRRDIVERDVVMRHRIREVDVLRGLARFVLSNPGLYVSMRAVKGFLDISHVTLRKYLEYFCEAYAVIPLEKFSYSHKERILNPRKFYPIDNGLLIRKVDAGRLLESIIVQHIRRYTSNIFYWRDYRGREVDIYLPDSRLAIQVVYELGPDNVKREEKPLEQASSQLGARPLIIYLYKNVESVYDTMNAVDFLLKPETIVSDFVQNLKS